MKIERACYFRTYLDPHKPDVAEWGAIVGYWRRDKTAAVARVEKIAETAVAQAGLAPNAQFGLYKQRLAEVEKLRDTIYSRIREAVARFIGARGFTSVSRTRRFLEGAIDLGTVVCLPLVLLMLWPSAAAARRRFGKAAEREEDSRAITAASKIYLLLHFEQYVEKGCLARDIENLAAGTHLPEARMVPQSDVLVARPVNGVMHTEIQGVAQ